MALLAAHWMQNGMKWKTVKKICERDVQTAERYKFKFEKNVPTKVGHTFGRTQILLEKNAVVICVQRDERLEMIVICRLAPSQPIRTFAVFFRVQIEWRKCTKWEEMIIKWKKRLAFGCTILHSPSRVVWALPRRIHSRASKRWMVGNDERITSDGNYRLLSRIIKIISVAVARRHSNDGHMSA